MMQNAKSLLSYIMQINAAATATFFFLDAGPSS